MEQVRQREGRALAFGSMALLFLYALAGCGALQSRSIEGLDGAFFGETVAVSSRAILVGAPGGSGDGSDLRGRAYLFERRQSGWGEPAVLTSPTGAKESHDEFAEALALSGDAAIVGAWGVDGVASTSGEAFVYERGSDGWRQIAALINPDAGERHLLGHAVAVDDTFAVVGAPGTHRPVGKGPFDTRPSWSGSVYLWRRSDDGWRYLTRLEPQSSSPPTVPFSDPRESYFVARQFGRGLAMGDGLLAIGAHDGTVSAGQVFVFRRRGDAWRQEAVLQEDRGAFGIAIALDHHTLAVAAAGVVYVYEDTGNRWRPAARLQPRAPHGESGFVDGGHLSIHDDVLVVGAARYDERRGAAYVFERHGDEWQQVSMLTADDTRSDRLLSGAIGDLFGSDVAVHGDTIVIGASFHDAAGPNNGAAYVFEKRAERWVPTGKLLPPLRVVRRQE